MIRRLVPLLRRVTQIVALALLVLLPILAMYTHYREAHSLHDLTTDTWQHATVQGVHYVVGDSPTRRTWAETTQGTFWSARLMGISLSDPLAGLEAIVSSRTFYQPMLWSLLIPLVITLVLGRVFCGWVCPMNTLLEIVDKCRGLLRWAELHERDVRFSLWNKYLVLAVVLGIVAITGVPFIALFYPPAVLSREVHLLVFSSTIGLGASMMLAIGVIELFVSKRWWCRYICPGGALYSLLGRFRVVRVVRNERNCVKCGECVRVCQFDLRPMLVQITGMECTNCGSCVRVCNDDALSFRLVSPLGGGKRSAPDEPPERERATTDKVPTDEGLVKLEVRAARESPASDTSSRTDSPLGQRVLGHIPLLVVAFILAPASSLEAHHILGLPHYSYKENYPQAPTLEYPATTGPFDVLMTSFPGHPLPAERTTIAFYIKNRQTGLPYDRPVSLRVLQTATFGANQVILEPTIHEPTTNQHKYFVTFPTDGEFIAELTMEVEGTPEVIPFLMVVGEPSAAKSVIISVAISLGVFLVVVRAVRIKRQRIKRQPPAVEGITKHESPQLEGTTKGE